MPTSYEVTTARLTPKGRVRQTQVIEAKNFRQDKRRATFTDDRGEPVATVKHVVRVCWSD
jgi:hypothetical protein